MSITAYRPSTWFNFDVQHLLLGALVLYFLLLGGLSSWLDIVFLVLAFKVVSYVKLSLSLLPLSSYCEF